jgi:hypothetical protein
MEEISGKIEWPVIVSMDSNLIGMITAETTVLSGITLVVNGIITADLVIEEGGTAIVYGMVNGCIRNAGHLKLYGVADSLLASPGAKTEILDTGHFRNP